MSETSASTETVLCSVDSGVAEITFNRAERNNSMTRHMQKEYCDNLERAAEDPRVRVIVVTGAGKSFCVGADMEDLASLDPETTARVAQDSRIAAYVATISKPVVAAINGLCAGLGFVHAVACDVRIAAAGIKFPTAFARRGIIAEHGLSWLVPNLVGTSRALDLLLSARIVIAEEALELGLVNCVAPRESVLDEAMVYARDLATNCFPEAMALVKRSFLPTEKGRSPKSGMRRTI